MLMSIEKAGQILGLSKHTLRKWIREGRVPVVRLGRRVLIAEEDIKSLIRSNRIPAGSPAKIESLKEAKA